MVVKQISIFAENRPGRLSKVSRILADNDINIRAMSVADTKDFGILRLIVNDAEKAHDVLKKAGCSVIVSNVLAVKMSDKPGALADVMELLYKNNVSVEYMYASFIGEEVEKAYLILRTDNNETAERALEGKYHMLSQDELGTK